MTPIPPWLDEMPLDTPDHVRLGWHMIGSAAVCGRLRDFDGLSPEAVAAVIGAMRRRIRKAAWAQGVMLHGW